MKKLFISETLNILPLLTACPNKGRLKFSKELLKGTMIMTATLNFRR